MGERIVYQAEDGSYVRLSDSGTTIGYRAEGDTSHGDLVADCIRHLTARAEKAEAERDALRARPVVHPKAMRVIVAEAAILNADAAPHSVFVAKCETHYKLRAEWYRLGAPLYSPPIDPASACPACGSWVGVAPEEVTP